MRRKKGFKSFLVYALAGAMSLSNITPALAYTDSIANVEYQIGVVGSNETTVYAELGSEFTVTIPKSLTLDGGTKTGSYVVAVEGDIAGDEAVKVVPEESFTLTSTGLADVTASIAQDKTSWSCGEILENGVIGKGSINASGIGAGEWEGTFWFNINLEEGAGTGESGSETQSKLTLSTDSVAMGTEDAVQVNAYLDGKKVNESVTWTSDNENIIVTNGLVETKASAEVGDTATVTVTADSTEDLSAMANVLSNLGIATVAKAEEDLSIDFVVTIVDIEYSVDELNLKAGESIDVTAKVIPEEINGTVYWSQTAISGISLVKNGNTVTINVADDMETGTYELVATYGDYSKTLKINIVEEHTCSYESSETTPATCTEAGVMTYACTCGDTYTEEIPATGHNFENGSCTECGEADPDYDAKGAGLYDANGVMLCTWEESGIDVETDYTSSTYKTSTTSGYYVLTNKYPTATKIVLPDGMTNIGEYAFCGCTNLASVTIPDNITNIGKYAFRDCTSLASVTIPNSVTSIGYQAFYGCTNLASVTIPDSITNIEAYTFSGCTGLTSIEIPDSVTSIGNNAFKDCTNLASVEIPDSVTSIEYNVFYNCSKLTSITIPNSVTSISGNTFRDCTSLTSVTIPNSVTSIDNSAFKNTPWLEDKQTENPLVIINNILIDGTTATGNVTIPNGVTSIEGSAFYNCTSITSITIPNSVTSIGNSTFGNCTGLTSITIPNSVTSIGQNAFSSCTKLKSIYLNANITSIEYGTFKDCTSLTSVTIPSGVTSIGQYAFSNTGLTSIVIPAKVTNIDQLCFYKNSLTSVTFKATSGWYYGKSRNEKTAPINSSDLSNTSTAATYLGNYYVGYYWSR